MGPVKDVKEEGRIREIDREIENIAVLRQLLRRSQLFMTKITKKEDSNKKKKVLGLSPLKADIPLYFRLNPVIRASKYFDVQYNLYF